MIAMNLSDLDAFARTIFGEARGELLAGQIAVAWAIRNRVDADWGNDGKPDWWGEGYLGVCRKPKQFSCWNLDDPNYAVVLGANLTQPSFMRAHGVACLVMLGDVPDPTHGATHYFNPRIITQAPAWAAEFLAVARIGSHHFFQDPKVRKEDVNV